MDKKEYHPLTPGKDGPCYYCGKMTRILCADPSEWPVLLPHKEEPGRQRIHHMGCVMERLEDNGALFDEIKELKKDKRDLMANLDGRGGMDEKELRRTMESIGTKNINTHMLEFDMFELQQVIKALARLSRPEIVKHTSEDTEELAKELWKEIFKGVPEHLVMNYDFFKPMAANGALYIQKLLAKPKAEKETQETSEGQICPGD